jgi:hypothetical protein
MLWWQWQSVLRNLPFKILSSVTMLPKYGERPRSDAGVKLRPPYSTSSETCKLLQYAQRQNGCNCKVRRVQGSTVVFGINNVAPAA